MLTACLLIILSSMLAACIAYTWGFRDGARTQHVTVRQMFVATSKMRRKIQESPLFEQPYIVQDYLCEMDVLQEGFEGVSAANL